MTDIGEAAFEMAEKCQEMADLWSEAVWTIQSQEERLEELMSDAIGRQQVAWIEEATRNLVEAQEAKKALRRIADLTDDDVARGIALAALDGQSVEATG